MAKVSRNAPCPCGSGRKYQHCCGARKLAPLDGLTPALRMKGGIRSNPAGPGFIAIVHTWDNAAGRGEPDEWRDPTVFATEEEALQHYKTTIRPALEQWMAQVNQEGRGLRARHRRLE